MLCGPKGSESSPTSQCAVCGRETELFGLPGTNEKYCSKCSADIATSILLTTEIAAATLAGRSTKDLTEEFEQLSRQLLARAQSA